MTGGEEKNGEHVQKTANCEHVATDMHSLDAGVKIDAVDREMIERGDRIGAKLVRSLLAHYDASPDLSLRAENERLRNELDDAVRAMERLSGLVSPLEVTGRTLAIRNIISDKISDTTSFLANLKGAE